MQTLNKIQDIIDQAFKDKVFTGCVVGVVDKNGLKEKYRFGEADWDSIFDVASITKTVSTGFLFMKLLESGQVKLEDKIQKYFPEFTQDENTQFKQEATILHLLSYTLDFQAFTSEEKKDLIKDMGTEQFRKNLFKLDLVSPPGTVYKYSDATADIQGQLIEKVTGRNLNELFFEWVAKPLGLENSTLEPKNYFDKGKKISDILPTQIVDGEVLQVVVNDPKARKSYKSGYFSGCAGLFSDLNDLSKVVQMFLNNGEDHKGNPREFLSRESFKLMTENQLDLDLPTNLCITDYSVNSIREILEGNIVNSGTDFKNQYKNKPARFLGKSGFTGPLIFMDLQIGLGLVLLCNRTFPDGPGSVERVERYHKFRRDLVKIIFQDS